MLGAGGLGCCRDRGIVGGEISVERRTRQLHAHRYRTAGSATLGVATAPIEHVRVRRWCTATGCPGNCTGAPVPSPSPSADPCGPTVQRSGIYLMTRTSWGQPHPSAILPAHILAVSRSGTSMMVIPPRYSVVSV